MESSSESHLSLTNTKTHTLPLRILPHSPNWDSLQVACLHNNLLAYCSNEQIFLIEINQGIRVLPHILTLNKVKKTRCMAVCLVRNSYCVIALKSHLIAIKKIQNEGDNEAQETLIQTSSLIIGLKWFDKKVIALGKNGDSFIYTLKEDSGKLNMQLDETLKVSGHFTITAFEIFSLTLIIFGTDDGTIILQRDG